MEKGGGLHPILAPSHLAQASSWCGHTRLFALVVERVGFLITTFIFLVIWMGVIERVRWLTIISVSIGTTAALYFIFALFLDVPLPSEALYQRVLKNIQPQIKFTLVPEKKNYLGQIRDFLKRVLGSPRVSWGIVAVQFAIILILLISLAKEDPFRTFSAPIISTFILVNISSILAQTLATLWIAFSSGAI
jgi:hypothetical protein